MHIEQTQIFVLRCFKQVCNTVYKFAFLQFQAVFIQQKVPQTNRNNPILISSNFDIITYNDDFSKGIRNVEKASLFLFYLIRC